MLADKPEQDLHNGNSYTAIFGTSGQCSSTLRVVFARQGTATNKLIGILVLYKANKTTISDR